jgi:hypothetical protein
MLKLRFPAFVSPVQSRDRQIQTDRQTDRQADLLIPGQSSHYRQHSLTTSSAFDPRNVEFLDKPSDCQFPNNHAPCNQLKVTAQLSLAVSLHSTSFTAARDYPTLRCKRHSVHDKCAANVCSLNLIARKL